MKIALVTTRLFQQPSSGGELVTARLVQALCDAGHEVQMIGRGPAGAHAPQQVSVGPLEPAFDSLSALQRLTAGVGAALCGRALTVHRLQRGGVMRRVHQQLEAGPRPDVVWVDHLQALPWLKPGDPLAPATVLLMHNHESADYGTLARGVEHAPASLSRWLRRSVLQRERRLLGELERQAMRRCSAVACVSESDAQALRDNHDAVPQIEVLPSFPLYARPSPRPGLRRVGAIGTWTWAHNRVGLNWLLQEVLPRLPLDVELVLAGSGLDHVSRLPRVRCLGRVDDVSTFYDQVDTVAISSWQGSGVQEKVIDAIGSGRPIVATSHALRGLGALPARQIRMTDDAEAFAQACVQTLNADGVDMPDQLARWVERRRADYCASVQRLLSAARPTQVPAH